MPEVLWVDDDQFLFPAVRSRFSQLDLVVRPAYTVAEASDHLDRKATVHFAVVLLHLIIPWGGPSDVRNLALGAEDHLQNYAGYWLLQHYPAMRARSVLFGVVGEPILKS